MSFCYSYIKPLSQEMAINFWIADNKRTPQYPVAQLTLLSRFLIAPSTFIKYYLQIKAHTYHLYLFFSAFFQPFFFASSPQLSKDDCELLKPLFWKDTSTSRTETYRGMVVIPKHFYCTLFPHIYHGPIMNYLFSFLIIQVHITERTSATSWYQVLRLISVYFPFPL